MRQPSPISQAWRIAPCPTVTFFHAGVVCKVDKHAVLQVGVFAQLDGVYVGAQHAAGPHTCVFGNGYVADENRMAADVGGRVDDWGLVQIFVEAFFECHNAL